MERRRALFDFDKYEPIEWAKCNGVCRVNTGVIMDSSTTSIDTEGKLKLSGSTTGMIFFDSKWSYRMQIYTYGGNSVRNEAVWKSASGIVTFETHNTATSRELRVNGGSWTTGSVNYPYNNDAEIQMFSRYNNSYPCTEYFNYLNIKKNGSYVRKFRFCKRKSDGAVFCYDTLDGTVYENVGSGYFTEATV